MKLATRPIPPMQRSGEKQRTLPASLVIIVLCVLLSIAVLLAVSLGSTAIPVSAIAQILLNGTRVFHFTPTWDATSELIVWQVRLPVVMGSLLVGAALAVSGTLFQGMLRNPLADPFLIGTSSGAALGAAIAFVLPFDTLYGTFFPLTTILAFIGALVTVLLVYGVARTDGQTPVVTLLLAGVVMNAVMVAVQTVILTISPHTLFGVQALFNWLSGNIAEASWGVVLIVGGIVLVGIIFSLGMARTLDTLALGEEGAAHLGVHVERAKLLIIIVASLITAAAVSVSGLIGFVGLVTPHILRLLLGPRHHILLPASALGGALFLILSDLLARTVIAPAVMPVGVFTALVGAPFFLYLLRRSKRDYKW